MRFIVIIPARYASTRIFKKPLVDINGKPMILHVLERAYESGANRVIVATDHNEVANVVKIAGGEVCITNSNHKSGTERLFEVVERYNFDDETIIVNVQCDEPMISAMIIYRVADNILKYRGCMTTIAVPINNIEDIFNPNVVKVVLNMEGYAIYFSRASIPWNRDQIFTFKVNTTSNNFLNHLGIYGYRASFIRRYNNWQPSPLETIEMLEQLRVLWYGEKIHVDIVHDTPGIRVDTPENLELARIALSQ